MNVSATGTPLTVASAPAWMTSFVTSQSQVMAAIFTLLFIVWAIFTLIALYHWVRYARNRWVAVPLVTAHLVVSAFLLLFMVSGFR